MKRFLYILLILLLPLNVNAKEMGSFVIPFYGKWQPSYDPQVMEPYGFQDIQNMRRDGRGLRGISGHTKINTSLINTSYYRPRSAYLFKKENPKETHTLVHVFDADLSDSRIYENTTPVPKVGNFTSDALYNCSSAAEDGTFSPAPRGNIVFSNERETLIWAGNEYDIAAFITSDAAIANTLTNPHDYTNSVNNSDTGEYATVNSASSQYFIIGSYRPLQGAKFYLATSNTSAATLTMQEWDGDSWNNVSITDNTSGLTENGTVTWSSTVSTSKPRYLEGYALYWYQFALSAGSATIYHVTVDAPMQPLVNVWDGSFTAVASCKVYDGTNYVDYTDESNYDSSVYVVVLDSLAAANHFVVGFLEPVMGIYLWIPENKGNTTAGTDMTVNYWDGDSWEAVDALSDGTAAGGISLAQTGLVSFQGVAKGTEFPREIVQEIPLYYYQITFDEALDAETEVYYIQGIPFNYAPSVYKFSATFQNRTFLFTDVYGRKNEILYSVYNSPDIYNGTDSGTLYYGDDTEYTGACTIYNVFTSTGYEQFLITKAHETYRMIGADISEWEVQKISTNIGCVAPQSMAVCDVTLVEENVKRQVAVWQAEHGFVMCDGATIQTISDDIKCYFDPSDSRYIMPRKASNTVGWYDPNLQVYHALISSGDDFDVTDTWGDSDTWEVTYSDAWGIDWSASIVTHNVELEYSLNYQQWTKIYREDSSGAQPLHVGFQATDNYGIIHTYGMADNGYLYRLENGNTWDGTAIAQYVWTQDLMLSDQNQIMEDTMINYLRLLFKTKTTGTTEDIDIAHYCDQALTTHGTNDQFVPTDIDMADGPSETRECSLGPCLSHSFKFSATTSSISGGMELHGMGVYFERFKTLSE